MVSIFMINLSCYANGKVIINDPIRRVLLLSLVHVRGVYTFGFLLHCDINHDVKFVKKYFGLLEFQVRFLTNLNLKVL